MMGGRLGLESQPGEGTEFHFDIDFARDVAHSMSTIGPPASLQGVKVLVVDDNATNRFILNEVLSNWNMNVTCVDGAAAALQVLADVASRGEPIQLVLLDMMMPEMDGLMLAEEIQKDARFSGIPLIMLSSSSAQESGDRYEAVGIVSQLPKPVKQADLLEQLLQIVGERKDEELVRQEIAPRAARSAHILLAEDGIINQKVAVGLLQAQGHVVTIAVNGLQAVAAFETETFDLILMDVEMPEMDGLEATAAIREKERGSERHIPIVAMTAHAIKGDQERFLKAGMDAHVAKPVEPKRLYQVIDQLTLEVRPF